MLIYQGMDVGTAKPSAAERAQVPYFGIDLVTPEQTYSVGAYYAYARKLEVEGPLIVAGGTGLYVKCLLCGMDEVPPSDLELRARLDALLAREGIAGLKAYAHKVVPGGLERLPDPDNPRRVVRMLERYAVGVEQTNAWKENRPPRVVGLHRSREALLKRIAARVDEMYAAGLIEEARTIREKYSELSVTASQAIGYREAFAVLDGSLDEQAAKEKTCIRTRRLAKRQMTWFRNQLDVEWVEVDDKTDTQEAARRVLSAWERCGTVTLFGGTSAG
jgi:tRNA dimethylallyltransferase